jgi:hypothetical protein
MKDHGDNCTLNVTPRNARIAKLKLVKHQTRGAASSPSPNARLIGAA